MKKAAKFLSSTVALFVTAIALTGCCGSNDCCDPCPRPCAPKPCCVKPCARPCPRPCAPAPMCEPVCY